MNEAIRLENAMKLYPPRTKALSGVSMSVSQGERICIRGAPGSGKTALMRLIGGMEPASGGSVFVFGTPLHALEEDARATFRNETFGVAQRTPAFLDALSVLENTALPLLLRRTPADTRERMAREMLESLGIGQLTQARPPQLSPVEARLACIARALAAQPKILLLDEPFADLSERETARVADALDALLQSGAHTMLLFTCSDCGVLRFDRKFRLQYGELREEQL